MTQSTVPVALYYTSNGPVTVTLPLYYHLYWPSDSPCSSLLFFTGPVTVPVALYYTSYWPSDTVPVALYYSLLAH